MREGTFAKFEQAVPKESEGYSVMSDASESFGHQERGRAHEGATRRWPIGGGGCLTLLSSLSVRWRSECMQALIGNQFPDSRPDLG